MKFIWLALLLCSCAQSVVRDREGHTLAIFQGDATNITFRSGDVYFHAGTLNHTEETKAAWFGIMQGATSIGGAASMVLLTKP